MPQEKEREVPLFCGPKPKYIQFLFVNHTLVKLREKGIGAFSKPHCFFTPIFIKGVFS